MQTNEDIVNEIASHYKAILELIGEDTSREGLLKTPVRAAKALLHATKGYGESVDDVMNGALFEAPGSGMIVVKDIEFYSLCEHHILPFFGTVSIGYMPNGRIAGLSKLARLTDMYARRLQVQERLAEEIVDAVCKSVATDDVIVMCRAQHLCMKMRGVEKQGAETVTIATRGRFADDYELCQRFNEAIR